MSAIEIFDINRKTPPLKTPHDKKSFTLKSN